MRRFSLINLLLLCGIAAVFGYVASQFGAPTWAILLICIAWGWFSPFHVFRRD